MSGVVTSICRLKRIGALRLVQLAELLNRRIEPWVVVRAQLEQAEKCRNLIPIDSSRGELRVVDRSGEPSVVSPVSTPAPVAHLSVARPQPFDRRRLCGPL